MPNLPLKSSIALISWQSVMAFNNAEPMLKRLKTATLIRHFRHVKKRAKAKKALTRLRTIANKLVYHARQHSF
jgi:IS5 family transposase